MKEVHVWTNRPFKYWKQAPDLVARPRPEPIPAHVHWDLFLGPVPERPYTHVYHPHDWRGWWDFGTGSLGDMACHTANLPFMALQLGLPTQVSARSGEINPETYPAWATITYEFPARGNLPPVKLTWYEGAKDGQRNLPPDDLFPKDFKPSDSGSLIIGSLGQMYSPSDYGDEQKLWPEEKFKDHKDPERILPRIEGGRNEDDNQKREWVAAIRAGKPQVALSNFDYAATLTEAMLLGNVAVRSGETFHYDPAIRPDLRQPQSREVPQAALPPGVADLSNCAGDPGSDDCRVGAIHRPGPRPRRISPVEARPLPPAPIRFDHRADVQRVIG